MRIDAYTHFFPKKFFDTMLEVAGQYKDMGKRVRAIPALYDLDVRKKIVDGHEDYAQILAYPQPPIENFAKSPQQIDEFIRIINDGFAELCAQERRPPRCPGRRDSRPVQSPGRVARRAQNPSRSRPGPLAA